MADLNRRTVAGMQTGASAVDEGLRAYMLSVYNYMAVGLAITGIFAYGAFLMATTSDPSHSAHTLRNGIMLTEYGRLFYLTPLRWVLYLLPLGFVFIFASRVDKMSVSSAQTAFWAFAALIGIWLASIFMFYTQGSIARVFFITSASFGGLSLYGYTTKKDLSGWRSFLIMGVIGIFIALIVNVFLMSSALHFAISVIGVLVFAGLTAYDTQQIKETYYGGDSDVVAGRKAIKGALDLYLDFINMFIFLLQLFGNRD
jgi:uncharacterized protein